MSGCLQPVGESSNLPRLEMYTMLQSTMMKAPSLLGRRTYVGANNFQAVRTKLKVLNVIRKRMSCPASSPSPSSITIKRVKTILFGSADKRNSQLMVF